MYFESHAFALFEQPREVARSKARGTGDSREPDRSQDVNDPAGKLLRLTPDGQVPQDNPFPNSPAFLVGIRNLQGWDWKDATTLYVAAQAPYNAFWGTFIYPRYNTAFHLSKGAARISILEKRLKVLARALEFDVAAKFREQFKVLKLLLIYA